MGATAFFLDDRINLLAGVLALGLFGTGSVAVTQQRGVAAVFLLLAGFVMLMILEYRHIETST